MLQLLPRTRHARPPLRRLFAQSRRVQCSSARPSAPASSGLALGKSLGLGAFAGMVSGLTGAGGGIILIPALAKLTTMTQQTINGTQHGAVTFSVLLGAAHHLEAGTCSLPLALMSTIPSIVFAHFGVHAAHRLSSKRLSLAVGAAMLLSAPVMVLKNSPHFPRFGGSAHALDLQRFRPGQSADFFDRAALDLPGFARANAKYALAGCFAGFISGLCGLGGGILVTAYLTAASEMPQDLIIGTSLVSILPTAGSAAYFNFRAKSIHVPTAVRVGASLGAAVYLTSKYVTHQVDEETLRGILATTLGTAAIVMIRRGL